MYGSSFGGTNRGPASERKRIKPTKSNMFVDFGTIALVAICGLCVFWQYAPLLGTAGYNVASGHITNLGLSSRGSSYGSSYGYGYRSRRGGAFVQSIVADFEYTANGRSYSTSVRSLPVLIFTAVGVITMKDEINKEGLAVRYDPNNPEKCVPVQVVNSFTGSVAVTMVLAFFVGLLLLALAGMANLSTDTWRPGRSGSF
ncbi:MAG: hypothetical protein KGS72_17010 [Cyanobacteria bacterium REEB67]|nr:hypothetical protein [Cyanobacteria bacterium REEB67]